MNDFVYYGIIVCLIIIVFQIVYFNKPTWFCKLLGHADLDMRSYYHCERCKRNTGVREYLESKGWLFDD